MKTKSSGAGAGAMFIKETLEPESELCHFYNGSATLSSASGRGGISAKSSRRDATQQSCEIRKAADVELLLL